MLLGRDAERSEIDRLLRAARTGTSGALVLRGEPGIGKTALLRDTAERAEGMVVLSTRGIQTEAQVPFSGLFTLLRPTLEALDRLAKPQAAALRGALALGPPLESDRFVIGAATLNLLAAYAEESPLLVLVDDGHWLDAPSAAAIVFAAGRLLADSVAMLLAVRSGDGSPVIEESGLPQIMLEGLDREAATALLVRESGGTIAADAAEWLVRATAANPLALIELAAEAPRLGTDLLEGPLPVRTSVERAFLRRIEGLSEAARRALIVAAAEDSGQLRTIERAARLIGVDAAALEEAELADLVEITLALLEFRHPLVRSAVYFAAPAGERRAAHQAIADVLRDQRNSDRRAWHLAAAALGPDEEVAGLLAAAAGRARARSGYAVAQTAFERAARLTPDEDARAARLLAAADAGWLAGHAEQTNLLLEEARDLCSEPQLRAQIEHLRGHALLRGGPVMAGHDVLVQAASEIESLDPRKAAVMLAEAADACVYTCHPERMLEIARRAWTAASSEAGDREIAFASLALGTALIYNGQGGEGARLLRRSVAIIDGSDALGDDPRLLAWAALGPLWLRESETGRGLFERAISSARRQGAVGVLPFALFVAGRDAATTDRWAVAEAQYDEGIRLARETGQAAQLCANLSGLVSLDARRGREADCREHAAEALALADHLGLGFFRAWALGALADLELGLGLLDESARRLEEKLGVLSQFAITDPDISPAPELVEVCVRSGRPADALRVADEYVRRAEQKGQPWALARAERCRGLLADDSAAERHFAQALLYHRRTPDTFEEARTRLCLGERLRRAKRRTRARPELRAAFDAFDGLGAAPWAERARLELLATGETARRRDMSTLDQLTPQELQIAMVLADGKTTREAASMLFLSPKTIEYHLRNAYRKLGVRSRDALALALAGESDRNEATVSDGGRREPLTIGRR